MKTDQSASELRREFWSAAEDAYVDRATFAAAFYFSHATALALATKGGGPRYTRVGRRALYRKGDVLAWASETGRTVANTAQLAKAA